MRTDKEALDGLKEELQRNLAHLLQSPFSAVEIRERVRMVLHQFLYKHASKESGEIKVKVTLEDHTAVIRGGNLFTHLLLHGHYVPLFILGDSQEYDAGVAIFCYIKDTLDDAGNVTFEGYPYIKPHTK